MYSISLHAPATPALLKPRATSVAEPPMLSLAAVPAISLRQYEDTLQSMIKLSHALTASGGMAVGLEDGKHEMPSITPQTVGVYFAAPIGDWSVSRAELPRQLLRNAVLLASISSSVGRLQLHLELALHWHSLGSIEKFIVAHVLSPLAKEAPYVHSWLEHMITAKLPEGLPLGFTASMPIDHMYDYGGFIESTNRVYGKLTPGTEARHRVCIVGGGPAGIIAADGLNRLGVNVTVLEQAPEIGGRLMTVRLPRHSNLKTGDDSSSVASGPLRSDSPTPMEMGGMRFAPFPGNAFYRLIELYNLHTEPFPNPGSSGVSTMYLIGDDLFDDGQTGGLITAASADAASSHGSRHQGSHSKSWQLLRKVRADYIAAVRPLLDPIMMARARADTAKLIELCDAAFRRFDHNTFQGGLDDLLREQGIAWGTDEWDMFGGIGIGVGGYDGYYTTGFLEEFRFLVDRRLEDHVFLPDGATSVLHAIVNDERIPSGRPSLRSQHAIRLNTEVERVIRTAEGAYEVTSLDKLGNVRITETYTDVFFAASPSEAIRLGLTLPQPGSLPVMSEGLAKAMRRANLVGATKLAIKVPIDAFEGLDIPTNIQSTQPFQQVYVLPATPGATSRVIFLSYQLGDNAMKTSALSGEEQFELFVRIIANAALSAGPGDPASVKFRQFAELLKRGKDRMSFVSWGKEKNFGGAFKMDRPLQASNTSTLWSSSLVPSDGVIFINEMMTAEGGFASGAVCIAVNGVQQFVRKHGGTLPPNSPSEMVSLFAPNHESPAPRYTHRGSGSVRRQPQSSSSSSPATAVCCTIA